MRIYKKGVHYSPKTEFKKGDKRITGENHWDWKGDNVAIKPLHNWVKKRLGKAKECIQCKSTINVHWANKSQKYKRDLTDWIQLCVKCHRKYDKVSIREKIIKNVRKNNKSGFNGVSFNKKRGKWFAYINIDYKQISLGFFREIDKAIEARRRGERLYWNI